MDTERIVDLTEHDGLLLIAKWRTGVFYTNQVAGHACQHPKMEGALVPLPAKVGMPALHALAQHFRGQWHHLEENDARVVDGILRSNGLSFLTVDRSLMGDSFEAWIHVRIDPMSTDGLLVECADWDAGVLTWPNSD